APATAAPAATAPTSATGHQRIGLCQQHNTSQYQGQNPIQYRLHNGLLRCWLPATRCTLILSNDGCGSPFRVRFCDSQVKLLSSPFVSPFSAAEGLPSARVFEPRISQLPPSFAQIVSPKPPLLSKIQERICWRTGSQPIISQPSVSDWS